MTMAPWYLILILSGTGKEIEVVPMATAQACETAAARYKRSLSDDMVGWVEAVCVASGAK